MAHHFKFMELPSELRLRVYSFLLPRSQRLFLDRENITVPSAFQHDVLDYGDAATLTRISKKVHGEVVPLLYNSNIVTIIKPISGYSDDLLLDLGDKACANIVSLECQVTIGLENLGDIWDTISICYSLEVLKLVFYHERTSWLHALAEYAVFATLEDLKVVVELYESIWARPFTSSEYLSQIEGAFMTARNRTKMYRMYLPGHLETISVSASVCREAAQAFATFKDEYGHRFNSGGNKDTDTKKCLVWSA